MSLPSLPYSSAKIARELTAAPGLRQRAPLLGAVYTAAVAVLIPLITLLFLRLYLLPASQGVLPPETARDRALGELAREPDGPVRSATLRALGLDAGTLEHLAGERVRVLGTFLDDTSAQAEEQAVLVLPDWCGRCARTRPQRTRHCGQCGTCRLAFDHHCAIVRPPVPTTLIVSSATA